ncbi:MAG TPA: hypothetical protein VGB85_33370 [Nannocystis sp.]
MPAFVSVLALALAAPGPAAPPLSPTADNDALHTEIAAGDPVLTAPAPPASLERLVAATEIAEEKLRQAADDDDAEDLLTLTAQGRRAAYGRTGEALHLCRLIAAADVVLARAAVPPRLVAAATDFRRESQDSLGATPCEDTAPPEKTDDPPPDRAAVDRSAAAVGPSEPPPPRPVVQPAAPVDRRRVRVGVGTLVPGLVLLAPMVGLLAYRAAGERDLTALDRETMARPRTAADDAAAAALGQRYTTTTAGAAVLGVTAAALVVTGAVFLATPGKRQRRMAVAPWGTWGSGGLVLRGKF